MPEAKPMDAYIRVSRRMGRAGPGYISPKVQREAIERWAAYKGIDIAEWHVDEDESGGTHERPGLERAVERAVTGDTGGIVSWKIDRFSRYTEGGLRDLRRLEETNARLAFVVEDIDTSGPMGKFVYTVMLAMSEYFLDMIKAGWRTAKSRAINRGVHIGPTPFGYQRVDYGDDKGKLVIDPVRGPIVTEAFAVAARDGLHATIAFLVKHAPERTWTTDTTRRFLKRKVYLGRVTYGNGLVLEDAHDALVTRAIHEAANHAVGVGEARRPSAEFPLSGVAECESCGGRMIGSRGGGDKRRMYRCGTRCDAPAAISADAFEAHVVGVLRAAFQHPGFQVGTGTPAVDAATAAVEEAERELDAFAADQTARRLLGDRYHPNLVARVDAVDEARARLHEALTAVDATRVVVPAELWDDLQAAERGTVLRGGLSAVIVGRGHRPLSERVRVVPKGMDRDAVAGAENASERVLDA
jgi:DNA invertase Pin-like site-specific DNA recombinase